MCDSFVLQMALTIPKHKFPEPRRNLPSWKGVATEEDRFTIAFAKAYLVQFGKIHHRCKRTTLAFSREIPVNGYGIADLVTIAWEDGLQENDSIESLMKGGKVTTRAFECKINDWRSALAQAVRYRFFSNQSIVVLPQRAASAALPYLETFKKVKIGLWSFDLTKNCIKAHHTPRAAKAKSEKYLVKVGHAVHLATKKSLPIQQIGRYRDPSHRVSPDSALHPGKILRLSVFPIKA